MIIINWFLSIIRSSLVMIDIKKIQFVCNYCENTDIDCSVVGGNEGVMVVYVRSCQNCETKASIAPLPSTFSDSETIVLNHNPIQKGARFIDSPTRTLGEACPRCGGCEWQCAECNGSLGNTE